MSGEEGVAGDGEEAVVDDGDVVLDAAEARAFAATVDDVSIAPLGRNYFDRYREVRDSVRTLAGRADDGVAPDLLEEQLAGEDVEYLLLIARNLENFAGEGLRREGEVEPYTTARAHARRLRPFVDVLAAHFGVDPEKERLAP